MGKSKNLKTRCLSSIFFIILAIGLIAQLHAQEELPVGARPMGMSGAFIAIADDANTVMWNPAGMTQLSQQELTTMWTNLFNAGVIQSHLGYVLPITNKLATGVDWTDIQFKDGELAYSKNRVHLALAYRPVDWLSWGINIKYLFSSTKLDDISEGDTRRVDGDIGILFRPLFLAENFDKIQVAFVLRDVANTGVTHEYQSRISHEEVSARKGVIGLAYETPLPNLIISAETDVQLKDRIRIGGEYQFGNLPGGIQAAIRAGLYKDWNTEARPSFALGGSLGVSVAEYAKILLEYAYLDSPVLSGTHRMALRIPFDFNPTLVDIEKVEVPKRFISSLLPYNVEETHFATVYLRNKYDKDLTVSVKLTIPGYLEETVAQNIVLFRQDKDERTKSQSPPEEVKIPVRLPDKILMLKNNKDLKPTIEVDYQGIRRYKPAKKTFSAVFVKPGLVPVTEGVPPFVAFIHPDDPIVKVFAQQITAQYVQADWNNLFPQSFEKMDKWRPLLNTIQIYESLRRFGLRYVPDPQIPYSNRDKLEFDDVKYPRDFLMSTEKAGDCDDVSVLIAALCESVGIRTALVEVPGHVFVLVNTGLYYDLDQSGIMALPKEKFIRISGTGDPNWDYHLAIPLDPSQQKDDTFIEAWENGLKTYNENAKIFIVRQEHKNYPPAFPPKDIKQPKIEDFKPIDERIKTDIQEIVQWQREYEINKQKRVVVTPDEIISSLINDAIEQAQRGELAEAKENLLKADAIDVKEQFVAIENNLGNIARTESNFEEALKKYEQAQERSPDDVGILLNFALTRLALGQKGQSAELLWRWRQKTSGNIPDASRLLGISPEPSKEIGRDPAILERKLNRLLKKVEQAETIADLKLEDFEFSQNELSNTTSGMYWKFANEVLSTKK